MPGDVIAHFAQSVNPLLVTGAGLALAALPPLVAGFSPESLGIYAAAIVSSLAVFVGFALTWYQRFAHTRREEKAADEQARIEQFLAWEAARKETLAPQLAELKQTIDRLRVNVHDARLEANTHALAAQGLRVDLQNANSAYFLLTQEVTRAQHSNHELTETIAQLTRQLIAENAENVRLRTDVFKLGHQVSKLSGAISGADIPAFREENYPPPTGPAPPESAGGPA